LFVSFVEVFLEPERFRLKLPDALELYHQHDPEGPDGDKADKPKKMQ
jgi:hypothetical protein